MARATVYKNHSLGLMTDVIYKVSGVGLVFDFPAYDARCAEAKAATIKRSERIYKSLEG